MSSKKTAAKPPEQRGTRYDLAWGLPQNEFQTPGVPLTWWADSSHTKENQARHRLSQLEPFFTSRNGVMVIYRVDYDGAGFVSERVIAKLGREVHPVRWSEVRTPTPAVRDAYQKMEAAWRERAGGEAAAPRRSRPRARRPKGFWAELGQGVAALMAVGALCVAAASAAVVYRALHPAERAQTAEAGPDPARYDRVTYTMRNESGGCDRMALNNRTGRTSWQGSVDCREAAREAASAEAQRTAPKPALAGGDFLHRK